MRIALLSKKSIKQETRKDLCLWRSNWGLSVKPGFQLAHCHLSCNHFHCSGSVSKLVFARVAFTINYPSQKTSKNRGSLKKGENWRRSFFIPSFISAENFLGGATQSENFRRMKWAKLGKADFSVKTFWNIGGGYGDVIVVFRTKIYPILPTN